VTDKPDDSPQFGLAMQALPNDRWRNFVIAIFSEEAPRSRAGKAGNPGQLSWAVREVGFGCKSATSQSVVAQRLINDKRIKAAIAEYSKAALRSISPQAINAVRKLIANPKSKHHAKAIDVVLNRIDPIETTHHVKVEQTYAPPSIEATEKVLARIKELAAQAGLPQLPPPIDAEFKELPSDE
jgi:hypothetical protein